MVINSIFSNIKKIFCYHQYDIWYTYEVFTNFSYKTPKYRKCKHCGKTQKRYIIGKSILFFDSDVWCDEYVSLPLDTKIVTEKEINRTTKINNILK